MTLPVPFANEDAEHDEDKDSDDNSDDSCYWDPKLAWIVGSALLVLTMGAISRA